MESFLEFLRIALSWPVVALVSVLFFRTEIAALLVRLRKAAGTEFDPPTPRSAPGTNALLSGDGNVVHGANANINADANVRRSALVELAPYRTPETLVRENEIRALPLVVNSGGDREQVLLTIAARAALVMQFEQIEGVIWGSQLDLLAHLNGTQSETPEVLKRQFYDVAAAKTPEAFGNYPFEKYLAYLVISKLIGLAGAGYSITPFGKEYLVWRVSQQKPRKAFGLKVVR